MTEAWKKRVYRRKKKNFITKDEWQKLRMACLKRDKFSCVRCEKIDKQGKGLEAHHIIPREEDGGNNLENLITLCAACHDFVEIHRMKIIAEIIGSYEDSHVEYRREKNKVSVDEGYSFTRPDWHKYVYGGFRR